MSVFVPFFNFCFLFERESARKKEKRRKKTHPLSFSPLFRRKNNNHHPGGTDDAGGDGWDDRILVEAVLPLLKGLAEKASAAATGQPRPASPLEEGEKERPPSGSGTDSPFDVRAHLARRFGLRGWFASQGVVSGEGAMLLMEEEERERKAAPSAAPASRRRRSSPSTSTSTSSSSRLPAVVEEEFEDEGEQKEEECSTSSSASSLPPLCVFDFDHTLVDFDSAEEVVMRLAPELAPMLTSLSMPADFIPLTNAVAAEAGRRGVSEGQWLSTLAEAGRRGLLGSSGAAEEEEGGDATCGGAAVLRAAASRGAEVRILSDANELFISAMLSAAGLGPESGVVSGVVTNGASFVAVPSSSTTAPASSASFSSSSVASSLSMKRLVVEPRHDQARLGHHGCGLCPSNLCKGLELRQLVVGEGEEDGSSRSSSPSAAARRRVGVSLPSSSSSRSGRLRRTVIYAGDGENDLCPALQLKGGDSLLVRRGRGLERLLRERATAAETETRRSSFLSSALSRAFDASLSSALLEGGACVFVWDTAEELRELVEALLLLCGEEKLLSDL